MATKQKSGAVKKAASKKATAPTEPKSQGRGHDLELYKAFAQWLLEERNIKITPAQVEGVRANFNQHFKKSDAFKEYKAGQMEERNAARQAREDAAAERKEAREAKQAERAERKEAREAKQAERAAKAKERAMAAGKRSAGKGATGKSAAAKSTPKSSKKSTSKRSVKKGPKEDF